MKKTFLSAVLALFTYGASQAQKIEFKLADPASTLQDADLGDMEFADIDSDGDNDLILIGKGGPIKTTIYTNDGDGNFTPTLNPDLINVFNGTIGVNDVDKDGDLDILISGSKSSTPTTTLYLNDGMGIFTATATSISPSSDGDFAFGDVDNDADDDIIITGISDVSSTIITKLYLSNGDGTFTESTSNTFTNLSSSIELFDCDGDNDLDLLISGSNYDDVDRLTEFYINDGTGNFSITTKRGLKDISGGDIAIGDTDDDGDLDVFICGATADSTETSLYINDGTGNFTLLLNDEFSDVSLGEVSLRDLDNDGDLDAFLIGTGEGGLANNAIVGNVYENLGNNNFVVSDSLIGGYFSSHAIADIDGDKDLDLVLGGTTIASPTRATWLYTNETPITASTLEFLIANSSDIKIYPNPTTGTFTITQSTPSFDDDNRLDLYSVTGKLLYSKKLIHAKTSVDLTLYPTGIYFIRTTIAGSSQTSRVVKN
jgi:hypothetical protein